MNRTLEQAKLAFEQADTCVGQNNETHRKQQVYYDWTKELILKQQEKIDNLETMMKTMMNHFNVAVPEKKPPQEGLAR